MTQSNLGFPLKDMQEAERLALQRDVAMSRHGRIQDPEKVQRPETLGRLPLDIPKYTPQNMPDFTEQVMALTPIGGATAYHGGGKLFKKFEDKYMLSGEGNWTYGAGHYSGEARGTGEAYRAQAARKTGKKRSSYIRDRYDAQEVLDFKSGNINEAIKYQKEQIKKTLDSDENIGEILKMGGQTKVFRATMLGRRASTASDLTDARKGLKELQKWKKNPHKRPGHLYEKEVPDEEIVKMLDWDKRMSAQPDHVKESLKKMKVDYDPNITGGELYNGLVEASTKPFGNRNAAKQRVSKELLKAGIPGNKFLDQRSRVGLPRDVAKGQKPTYNFVEFTAKGKEGAIRKIDEQPVEEVFANTPALGKLSAQFSEKGKQLKKGLSSPVGVFSGMAAGMVLSTEAGRDQVVEEATNLQKTLSDKAKQLRQ